MTGGQADALGTEDAARNYPGGLREKLMAAVRRESRADIWFIEPSDPVFGGVPCQVGACRRAARLHDLCEGHYQRWNSQGRPDKGDFATATSASLRGHGVLPACRVEGCGYGRNSTGLCVAHVRQWHQAGRPEVTAWLSSRRPVTTPAPHGRCRITGCELWSTAYVPLCVSHAERWRVAGRPVIEEFAAALESAPHHCEMIAFLCLPPRLRLEMKFPQGQVVRGFPPLSRGLGGRRHRGWS